MSEQSVKNVARAKKRAQKLVSGGAAVAVLAGMLVVAGVGVQSALAAEAAPQVSIAPTQAPVLGEDVTVAVTIANEAGSSAVYNLSATLLLPDTVSIVNGGALGEPSNVYVAGEVLPGKMVGTGDTCAALGLVNPNPGQAGKCAVPPGKQFAVFQNFSDLPATANVSTSVVLRPKVNLTDQGGVANGYAVGDALEITMNAYTSENERFIPIFPGSTGIGGAQAEGATSLSHPGSIAPKMRALRVEKSEPSAESELLRGVHGDRTTIYTLEVHHTGEGDLTDSTVVDYLPAGLEYLGSCVSGDNTTDAGNGVSPASDEWAGSGSMTTGNVGEDCLDAASVETVQGTFDEDGQFTESASGQVFTKVTWILGTLAGDLGKKQNLSGGTAGEPGTTTIRYRAGVPLFENTLDFGGSTPDAATGAQGANLDNNRGASTRPGTEDAAANDGEKAAYSLTNIAVGGGNWRGVTATLEPVWSEDNAEDTVEVSDVRVLKSVRIGDTGGWSRQASFVQGDIADYRLQIATSEYVGANFDAASNHITDTFANGLCPVYPMGLSEPVFMLGESEVSLADWNAAMSDAGIAECQWSGANSSDQATLSGASVISVAFDASSGRFSQQFELDSANIAAISEPNANIEIIYSARQNQSYVSDSSDGKDGSTSSGDTVINTAEFEATTTPREEIIGLENIGGADVGDEYFVWDDSHASVVTALSQTSKQVLRNITELAGLDADEVVALDYGAGAIVDPTNPAFPWTGKETKPFGIGDDVWFKIHWDTAVGSEVRNPVLTDFLPEGVTFDPAGLDSSDEWGSSSNLRVVASKNGVPLTVDADHPLRVNAECSYTSPAAAFSEFVGKVALSDGGSRLTWSLGSDSCYVAGPSKSDASFWPGGTDLDFYIKVTVTDAQAFGKTDISQNLAKYQQENVDGQIYFERRQAEIVPDMTPRLVKGIASVDGVDYDVNSNVDLGDRDPVVQTDELEFRLDVTSPASATSDYEIWDALPEGIVAADLVGYDSTSHEIDATAQLWVAGEDVPTPTVGFTAHAYDWADLTSDQQAEVNEAYKDRSIVIWQVTAQVPGSTPATDEAEEIQRGISLLYSIAIPDGSKNDRAALLAQRYTNTASIVQFDVKNLSGDSSTVVTNVPTVPAGTAVPTGGSSEGVGHPKSDEKTVPVSTRGAGTVAGSFPVAGDFMTDPSGFELPDAEIVKSLYSTEIGPTPQPASPFGEGAVGTNNGNGQIVQGEFATFEYKVTVPAHTSVPAGAVLADRGFLNIGSETGTRVNYTVDSASIEYPAGADAAGFTFEDETNAAANKLAGRLIFDERYDAGEEDRIFTVHLRLRVANASASALANGNTLYNVATFTYNNGQGSDRVLDDNATVQYIDPVPTLSKTVSGTQGADGEVTFTLTAGNTNGRPTLFDTVVYDCLPAGFSLPTQTFAPSAGAAEVVDEVKCSITAGQTGANTRIVQPDPTGTGTLIKWTVGALNAGSPQTFSFKALVDGSAAGGASNYTNSAQIKGYTLPDSFVDEPTDRRGERTTGAQRNVPIASATQAKTVTPASAPVGETVTYTLTTSIPANANYYFVDLHDQLPLGVEFVTGSVTVVNNAGLTISAAPQVTSASASAGQQLNWVINPSPHTIPTSNTARQIVITFKARITDAVATVTPTNVATFSWNTNQAANNPNTRLASSASAQVTILNPNLTVAKLVKMLGAADSTLATAKTGNPDQKFSYRLRVTNTGNTPAHQASITDCLPAGVVGVTNVSHGGVYSATPATGCAGGTITWANLAAIAGSNAYVDLTYDAQFAASSVLTSAPPITAGVGVKQNNTAKVVSYTSFANDGWVYQPGASGKPGTRPGGTTIPTTNTSSTAGVTPQFPNVTLTKAVADTTRTAYVGEPFEWVLTATNAGAGAAQKVTLTDTLPENWEFTAVKSITIGGVAQALTVPTGGPDGPLVWTFGEDAVAGVPAAILSQNQSIVIRYTATPKNPEAITAPGVGDSNPHINRLSATTTDRTNLSSNASGSYTGPEVNDRAFLRVADLKLVKNAIGGTVGGADSTHPLAGVAAHQWVIGQPLESGVYEQPQWEIVVTNHGPSVSYGPFRITDTPSINAGVTVGSWTAIYVSASGVETTLGTYSGTEFSVGTNSTSLLANGSDKIVLRANVTIDSSATPGETVENVANVLGRTYESPDTQGPNAQNPNTDGDERVLVESADLQVTKTVGPTPNAGGAITWSITPRNNGPSVSRNTAEHPVTITDTVPEGVNGVADPSTTMWAATATNGFPANAGDTITFSLKPGFASLTVGVHTAITLSGTVDPAWTPLSGPQEDGSIVNTAVIAPGDGLTPDPKESNNTNTVPTTPTFNTTLGLAKNRVVKVDGAWVLAASLNPVPPVHTGDPVHYLVSVSNNGAAVARNVVVVDEVPEGLSYIGFEDVSPATWSRSAHATVPWDQFSLTSDEGTLPVGASRSVVVEYGTEASTPAHVQNCVTVSSSDNSSTARDCEGFSSDRVSDLSLQKDVIDEPEGDVLEDGTVVFAGNTVTYRLTVTNEGPSDALGAISVADTLPAGFSYVAGTAVVGGASVEPTIAGQQLTWEVVPEGSTLLADPENNTIAIEFQALVSSTHGAANGIVNEATVNGHNDPNPANNTDDALVNIETLSEMSIEKKVEDGPWVAGTTVTYNLVVANAGPSAAPTARVVDTLPSGLTMVSMTGENWDCIAVAGAQTGACDFVGAHPVGTSAITVVAKIASGLPTSAQANPFVNVADLSWTDSRSYDDPAEDPRHDSDDATITVTTLADLGLVKTAVDPADDTTEVTSAVAGEQARYRIDVTNYGPSDAAADLVVTDTLPLGVAYVAPAGTTASEWNIEVSDYDPAVQQTVTFTRVAGGDNVGLPLIGTDPTNAPAILFDVLLSADLVATSLPDVPALLNTATVVSGTAEPEEDPHSNTDDASLVVVRSADLEIVKSHPVADERERVYVGEPLPFTIDVTNHGPSVSSGFTIADTMPVGFEVTSPVGVVLDAEDQPTGWEILSIEVPEGDAPQPTTVVARYTGVTAVGENAAPLVIETLVHENAFSETDDVVNHVAITEANEPDPEPSNNQFDDPIHVQPLVTLVIEKTAVGEFKVGQTGLYSITVENRGPHTDHGPITVTDQLPAGLSFRESPKLPEGVTVDHDRGLVTWTLTSPLGVGETVELLLSVNVAQAAYEQPDHKITNVAEVTSESQLTDDSVLVDDAVVQVKPVDPLVVTGGDIAGGLLAAMALLLLAGGGVYLAGRRRQQARHG